MFVDRLLSAFSIRAKVLLVLVPLVMILAVVGVVSLQATGLLQSRLRLSSEVLETLSGFREVSESMNRFLAQSSTENRDEALASLSGQGATMLSLQKAAADVGSDTRALESSESAMSAMSDSMDRMWSLHNDELSIRRDVAASLTEIKLVAADLKLAADKVRAQVRNQENSGKTMLREATRSIDTAAIMQRLSENVVNLPASAMQTPETQQQALMIKKAMKTVKRVVATGDDGQALASLEQAISRLVANSGLDSAFLHSLGIDLSAFAPRLRNDAIQHMIEGTHAVRALDKPLAESETLVAAVASVGQDADSIEIEINNLLRAASTENQQRLVEQLTNLTRDTVAVGGVAGSLADFPKMEEILYSQGDAIEQNTEKLVKIAEGRQAQYAEADKTVQSIWKNLVSFASTQEHDAHRESDFARLLSAAATVSGVLVALLAGASLMATLRAPIARIARRMQGLATGDLQSDIVGCQRKDEIGDMARALEVFAEMLSPSSKLKHVRKTTGNRLIRSGRIVSTNVLSLRKKCTALYKHSGRHCLDWRGEISRKPSTATSIPISSNCGVTSTTHCPSSGIPCPISTKTHNKSNGEPTNFSKPPMIYHAGLNDKLLLSKKPPQPLSR